jgi:hypothetical protein
MPTVLNYLPNNIYIRKRGDHNLPKLRWVFNDQPFDQACCCFRQEKEELARRRKDEMTRAKAEENRLQREAREKKVLEAR